ncbi:MAG: T9SS type A sorting domain-containing protein [Bacteroidota bacterium]
MQKITLFLCLVFLSAVVHAQEDEMITLSQSENSNEVEETAVACWGNDPDAETANQFFDNRFARIYNLADYEIEGDFEILSVEFGQGLGEDKIVDVNLYTLDDEDPNEAEMTLIYTQEETIFAQADETIIVVNLDEEVEVENDAIIMVEIFAEGEGEETFKWFFPGINSYGQTQQSWFMSPDCGFDEWMDPSDLGAGPQEYIIDVIGQPSTMSTASVALNKINSYPNPVNDYLSIDFPDYISVISAQLSDMNGKSFNTELIDGKIDMSHLATGNYILELKTSAGTYNEKVIKK